MQKICNSKNGLYSFDNFDLYDICEKEKNLQNEIERIISHVNSLLQKINVDLQLDINTLQVDEIIKFKVEKEELYSIYNTDILYFYIISINNR